MNIIHEERRKLKGPVLGICYRYLKTIVLFVRDHSVLLALFFSHFKVCNWVIL